VFEWWKSKLKLRAADGKTHHLSYSGDRESAVPMVESDPKSVAKFLKDIENTAEGKQPLAAAHIATVKALIETIKKEQKRTPTEQAKADDAIAAATTAMVEPIEFLLGVAGPSNSNLDFEGPLQSATDRLAAITAMEAIGSAKSVGVAEVTLLPDDRFKRYRNEYAKQYAPGKNIGASFQWPHRYLRLRAARRAGSDAEDKWRPIIYPGATKQSFVVTRMDNTDVEVIPDVVQSDVIADIKNVKTLSYTQQLRDFALVADPDKAKAVRQGGAIISIKRRFEVVARHETHRDGKQTDISGNLLQAVHNVGLGGGVVHFAITDLSEQIEASKKDKNAWPRS
jgi:hypothetical protein